MRSGKLRQWPWAVAWTLGIALVVVAVLLIAGVRSVAGLPLHPAEAVRDWLGAAFGLGGPVLAVFGWAYKMTHDPPVIGERIDKAKDLLARAVKKQWTAEVRFRDWQKRPLIPVCWQAPVDPYVPPHSRAVENAPRTASNAEITKLAENFRACESRRLVILGGPGTGKTTLAVQLLLKLLETHAVRENEPVPVILSVAQWDTRKCPTLFEWLSEQLYQEYPDLRSLGVVGVRQLLDLGHVLPILDGLDELPKPAQTTVIRRLNDSLGPDDQLILTSRTKEYTDAVGDGRALDAAAVLVPAEVTQGAAANYLTGSLHSHQANRPEWRRALEVLRTEPDSVLAKIAERPLDLWLLRTVYVKGNRDPGELTEPARFSTPEELRAHLLKHLIAALVPPEAGKDWARSLGLSRAYEPDDVQRWLAFLAHHLTSLPSQHDPSRCGTCDFEWWRLAATRGKTLAPRRTGLIFGATVGFVVGLTFGIPAVLAGAPSKLASWLEGWPSFVYPAVLVVGAGVVIGVLSAEGLAAVLTDDSPGYADFRTPQSSEDFRSKLKAGLRFGLTVGFTIALTAGPVTAYSFGLKVGLTVGLVGGISTALITGFIGWSETSSAEAQAVTPQSSLRADRMLNLTRFVYVWLLFGLESPRRVRRLGVLRQAALVWRCW